MIEMKRALAAGALAGALGLTLLATSSFANGPISIGPGLAPVSMPKVFAAPHVRTTPLKTQLLQTYRQVRTFWLSRAIVR
jgi:hypothetical protein